MSQLGRIKSIECLHIWLACSPIFEQEAVYTIRFNSNIATAVGYVPANALAELFLNHRIPGEN